MSNLTKKTYNILPSRLDYFIRRMDRIKKAADSKIPPIHFTYTDPSKVVATTIPLDPILIGRAKANLIPDTRQLPNGDWVRDVLPITVEYGELTDAGFEYIGNIRYGQVKSTATGQIQSAFFPTVVQEIGLSDEDYEKRVKEVSPQLTALATKFQSYKDLNCDHCSLKGDNKERHSVEIVRATKDQKRKGKGGKFTMDLKKGDILQIGTACMERYSGINVNALAAFYELDRAIGAYGPNGSPQNPAGWGYKEMGVWDFAERMVQYYGARERDWLAGRRWSLWESPDKNVMYDKGTLAPLIRRKGRSFAKRKKFDANRKVIGEEKYEEGCFVMGVGERLLKGRQFDLYEKNPAKDAKWMFQPFKGQGSVEAMQEMWEQGIKEAKEYITVPVVNEVDGSVALDPNTGDVLEQEIEVPNSEFIEKRLRKDWKLKIVDILPPSTESKYVKKTTRKMMDWLDNQNPANHGGDGDLIIRLQQTKKLGYVGDKTKQEFLLLWKLYMMDVFESRKKADKEAQRKAFQKIGSDQLEPKYPNGRWYSFLSFYPTQIDGMTAEQQQYLQQYVDTIYSGSRWSYGSDYYKAFSEKFGVVFLDPQQWTDFPAWAEKKKKDDEKKRKEREAKMKYDREWRTIYRNQRNNWPRPIVRTIPYDPSVTEFLDFMGWSSLDDPARYKVASSLFQVSTNPNTGTKTIRAALLTDDQYDRVVKKFRPIPQGFAYNDLGILVPQPPGGGAKTTSPPPAPTPSPAPVAQTSTPTSFRTRITQAEAKRKAYAAKQTSTYQGVPKYDEKGKQTHPHGDMFPMVEGWVTWKSKEFPLRPDFKEQGRSIQMIDPQGNCWVIFHPSASPSQPRIGNYYNLFDVEIMQNDEYNGLKQNVINDPTDRMDLEFVDATTP